MYTPGWLVGVRLATAVACAILPFTSIVRGQQTDAQSQAVTAEQRKQIDAAKTVEELTSLAKQFMISGKESAAKLCIEQICVKDPKLLTDAQVQTSFRLWNDLWFTTRAEIQARKLAASDAAGRLELARWLKQGGVFAPARTLVADAIRINPNLPEARQLLHELEPPLRLDFRYALTKTVLLTEYMDTTVKVEPGRGFLFLLAPVHYPPASAWFSLIPGSIKVSSDAGKASRVLGLLLTEEPPKPEAKTTGGTGAAVIAAVTPTPTTPVAPSDQPPDHFTNTFYERLQVEPRAGMPTLLWQNPFTSRPTGTSDRTTGGTSGTGGTRTTGRGTGYASGTGARDALAEKRGEMPANGWLGLLVKFPEDANKLTIELPETGAETIDLNLLRLVHQQSASSGQPEKSIADLIAPMIQCASDPSAPTAQLALAWLGANSSQVVQAGGGQPQTPSPQLPMLRAMLEGVQHPARRVRQTAFEGLMKYPTVLPAEALDFLRETAPEKLITSLLTEVESTLASAAAAKDTAGTPAPAAAPASDAALQRILEPIPPSQAPSNAFAILGACLNSKHAQARQEALRILLADGSRQSLQILSDLGRDALKTVAGQVGQIKSDERKAAVLRLLFVRPDNNAVTSMLAGCGGLSVTVTSEDDPLLTALKIPSLSVRAKVALMELLGRSNLFAVANSPSFGQILNTVREDGSKQPQVMAALLSMVASHFQLPYQSPIPRGSQGSPAPTAQQGGGFEDLLAQLAMDSTMKDETASAKAALALVASGRVSSLKDQLVKSENDKRCLEIIKTLGRAKELRDRDALPFFLASILSREDPQVLKETLSLLTIIHDDSSKDNRWRINLAVRQGVDQTKLIHLTVDDDPDIARQATALLKRTIGMTSKEAEDFDRSTGENARATCLTERILAERNANPVGQFACLLLLDTQSDAPPPTEPSTRSQQTTITRTSVPLVTSRVTIDRTREGLRISADGVEIGRVEAADAGGDQPGATPVGALPVNPAALISDALKSADARKEGLAGKVDITPIKSALDQQKCELKPDALGGWAGEVTIPVTGGKTPDRPVSITAAKILLQPLTP